ncbi:uncharacterized protein NFIA_041610 [Aspergillus fischeri NRRL 181]|uniref:Uncharacterized protein n=1 Tax=Neosartorya fischeri (strain ATCC 1020 / DSM 3700 / CBS 544.65 / FGSC A1164 / JCM 1740 / NRRL 181 / WB 181) TaxID=331117 RepID=A1D0R3_NEOFI|nr:uncharacterized protein NFIA_041610 [Aspergillus fischeri NRRL 181]EAW24583.1 hypothetical protein NFIA_041610 [Aspergillus fischeri NRRL 181]KAG2026217.1 hypothetical protein GB937_001724 [Aspergillus fischeri]
MEDKKAKVKLTILGHLVDVQDGVGKIGEAVHWARNFIRDEIKDVPEGLAYDTSQLHYYVETESLLLPNDMEPSLKADLTKRDTDLYKLVIDF